MKMTTATITPDMKLGAGHAALSFSDCDGPATKHHSIQLVVDGSEVSTVGKIVDVDRDGDLIVVELDWAELEEKLASARPSESDPSLFDEAEAGNDRW